MIQCNPGSVPGGHSVDDKLDATDLPDWSWYRGHSGAWPPYGHIAPGGVPGGHSVDDEPEALPAAAPATSTCPVPLTVRGTQALRVLKW